VPLFSYCSQRELAKVAKLANELELPAGHTLIHEDAEVTYSFFVLVDGEAASLRGTISMQTPSPRGYRGPGRPDFPACSKYWAMTKGLRRVALGSAY
jgi:hypothetical protein